MMNSKETQNMSINGQKQMEPGFEATRTCPSTQRPRRRLVQAGWWFQRMRQVVDKAADWRQCPVAHPEQIHFPE